MAGWEYLRSAVAPPPIAATPWQTAHDRAKRRAPLSTCSFEALNSIGFASVGFSATSGRGVFALSANVRSLPGAREPPEALPPVRAKAPPHPAITDTYCTPST